jgi:hypothetical protein
MGIMSFLGVGMNGVVQIGPSAGSAVAIANLKNATFSIKNDQVEEFVCNGQNTPALLANTNQHCEIKAEQLWTDNAMINAAGPSAGSAVTIIIGPGGISSGKPKYTFTSCIIGQLDLKWDQKSAVATNFTAKGILSNVGTFTE